MSTIGLSEALRAMDPGDTISQPIRLPVAPDTAQRLDAFRSDILSRVTRVGRSMGAEFTSVKIDTLADNCTIAIRCIVVTRLS